MTDYPMSRFDPIRRSAAGRSRFVAQITPDKSSFKSAWRKFRLNPSLLRTCAENYDFLCTFKLKVEWANNQRSSSCSPPAPGEACECFGTVIVGQALPALCPATATCGKGTASDSGAYPIADSINNVWNYDKVDGMAASESRRRSSSISLPPQAL
jgi:hypothetical protein